MSTRLPPEEMPPPPIKRREMPKLRTRLLEAEEVTPNRPGGVLSIPLDKPFNWYLQNIARNPLLMAGVQGGLGYLGGRYVASPLMEWWNPSKTEESARKRKLLMSLLGAGAGVVPPAFATMGRMGGAKPMGLWGAMTNPFKAASFDEGLVPTQPGTKNLILADPLLSPYEKAVALMAVDKAVNEQAQNDRGYVTIGDLARGAVSAGVGYAGASLLGNLLGAGFGLTPTAQKHLGMAGLLGGALAGTGLLRIE